MKHLYLCRAPRQKLISPTPQKFRHPSFLSCSLSICRRPLAASEALLRPRALSEKGRGGRLSQLLRGARDGRRTDGRIEVCAKVFLFMWRGKGQSGADEEGTEPNERAGGGSWSTVSKNYTGAMGREEGPLSDYSATRIYKTKHWTIRHA